MYFSKDTDTVPTFELPGFTGAGPHQDISPQLLQQSTATAPYLG